MTITILQKQHTRLRVKETKLPEMQSKLLGNGLDVMSLPEGHLCCPKCSGYKFECWVILDSHRLEMGCMACGDSTRLLFPLDVDLLAFGKAGRFTCKRHPKAGMILIHNVDVISCGCEKCNTEVDIKLKKASGLVMAS
jgi:hypothetical protein